MGAALSLPRGAAAQAPRTISCGRSRAPSTCQTTGRRGELNIGDFLFAAAYLRDRPRNRKRTRAPLASFFRASGGRRLTPAAAVTVTGVLVSQYIPVSGQNRPAACAEESMRALLPGSIELCETPPLGAGTTRDKRFVTALYHLRLESARATRQVRASAAGALVPLRRKTIEDWT
jgi:hypothetical protein